MKLSLIMGLLTYSIFQYILFRWLPLKKFITVNCVIFFFFGMLLSGFLTQYFYVEKYKEDIFIADGEKSGRNGALFVCLVLGTLKSSGERKAISCKYFRKHFPNLKIGDLPFGRPKPEDTITYEVPVFVSPQGGIHLYNEKEKRYDPGVHKLPLWSFQTFFMLPLPLLLLFNLFKYMLKKKG